jgi:PAS domain S-box-containing protein
MESASERTIADAARTERQCEEAPRRDASSRITQCRHTMQDITLRQQAEKACARPTPLAKGRSQPAWVRGEWSLAVALILFSVVPSAFGQQSNTPQHALPTLTTAHAAHSLSFDEAQRGYPVHLRAVVTYYDPDTAPWTGAFFACDATGCIAVRVPPRPILPLQPGTLVDLHGVSDPGGYAPIVLGSEVHVVGQSHLPAYPQRRNLAQLLTGADDGQWVEVEGVVHSMAQSGPHITITLALRDGMIRGITPREAGADYTRLIDSRVTIRGNITPVYTKNRQMVGARLLFPSLAQVRVEEPAPPDPFSLPESPISSLLRFAPDVTFVHRVRVRGQVTLRWPGQWLFIQDGAQGLFIPTFQKTPLKLGEVVEVVGFPAMGEYTLMLEDAVFKPEGPGPAIAAAPVTAPDAMKGDYDAKLIQIQARLVNKDLTSENPTLVMSSGGMLFLAVLPRGTKAADVASWRVGSELRLTGVCSVQVDKYLSAQREGAAQPESFRVLVRSPQDVVVLQKPSWWTAGRILVLLAICLLTMVFGTLWVAVLKRRVWEQTETIRATLESTADGILVVDSAGKVVAHNQKFAAMWAVPEHILKRADGRLLVPFVQPQLKDPEAFTSKVRALFADPKAKTDDVVELKDGRVFELHSEPQAVKGMYMGRVWGFRDITERKQAEEALRESEQFNREVIANAQEGVAVYDREFRYQVWNRFMEELTGVPASEVLGKNAFDLFPHLREQKVDVLIKRALAGEVVHTPDTPFRVPTTGKAGWVSNIYSPHFGASGEILGVIGIIRDVTERKQAEQALIEERHLLHTLMDNLPDLIYFKDRESRFTRINKAHAKAFGLSDPGQAVGKTDFDFYTNEHAQQAYADEQEIIRTGQPMVGKEEKETWPDGRVTWVSTTKMPLRDARGNIIGTFGVSRDVTERKQAEEALQLSEHQLAQAMDLALLADWELNLATGIFTFNDRFYALYGTTAEREGGYEMSAEAYAREFLYPEDVHLVADEIAKALVATDPGATSAMEHRIRRRDGEVRQIAVRISVIKNSQGVTIKTRGVNQDITERKQADEALRESEAGLAAAQRIAHLGSWHWNIRTDTAHWSEETFRIYGQTLSPLGNHRRAFQEMIHPDDRMRADRAMTDALNGTREYNLEYRIQLADGSEKVIHSQGEVLRDEAGNPTAVRGIDQDITERKRAEEALRKSEERYRDFISHSHEGVWRLDLDQPIPLGLPAEETLERLMQYGYIAECNLAHARTFGFSTCQEMIGKRLGDLVPPSDQERLESFLSSARSGWGSRTVEFRGRDKSGALKHLSRTEIPIVEDGMLVSVWGITRDVSKLRLAEEALRESEARFRATFENAGIGMALVDLDGHPTKSNPALQRMLGYGEEELARIPFTEFTHPDDRDLDWGLFSELKAEKRDKYEIEKRYLKKNGEVMWGQLTASLVKDMTGRPLYAVGMVQDITERKRAEEAAGSASAYNRRLLEASLDPLVTIAPDGKITDVNNATERVTGLPRQQLIGTDFSDYFTDSEKARAGYEQVFREGLVQNYELQIRRRDGHVTPVLYNASVYRDGRGDVMGVFAAARDITERKRAEEEQQGSFEQLRALAARLESVREEERKRVAREIHDELGQALTLIKIDSSALIRDLPADKKHLFEPILKEVDSTIASVRKISSELRPGILDASGLVGAVEWAADEFESRTGIKCHLDLPQDEMIITEEGATALFRIFQETLTNVARHAHATEVDVRLAKEDGNPVLELHDNGKGITEEQAAAANSLGILGMRERALLLGGEITIRGVPGKGTTVKVRLPHTLHKQAGAGT